MNSLCWLSMLSFHSTPFTSDQRNVLLSVKGIGPTVVQRLEEMGFSSLEELAKAQMEDVVAHGAAMFGSSCRKNSPQSRAAIDGAIRAARQTISTEIAREE
jgi:predicted RecB family nuclease